MRKGASAHLAVLLAVTSRVPGRVLLVVAVAVDGMSLVHSAA